MAGTPNLTLEVVAEDQASSGWSIRKGMFREGVSNGVEVVEVRNGDFSFCILPTRGMGIWHAHLGETRIGWDSPVQSPVHPSYVNLQSRNGLGWLDGFNELLCRCGLSFNGPPGRDEAVGSPIESDLTLHGKIANLPAHSVEVIHGDGQTVGVRGVINESTLFGPNLQLESTITTQLGQKSLQVKDVITNCGSASTELELLYHINVGHPVIGEGSKFALPASRVVPRDSRAAEDIETYLKYLGPTVGYTEQVYFFESLGDEANKSRALLQNQTGDFGVSVQFDRQQLPCFSQWKCTQATADGYVTGLEPGTNYPNFKSFERRNGRVKTLEPRESYTVELSLEIHSSSEEVRATLGEIERLQGDQLPEICPNPVFPYCSND